MARCCLLTVSLELVMLSLCSCLFYWEAFLWGRLCLSWRPLPLPLAPLVWSLNSLTGYVGLEVLCVSYELSYAPLSPSTWCHRSQRLIGVLMKGKRLIIWKATSSSVMLCLAILQGQMFRYVYKIINKCAKIIN